MPPSPSELRDRGLAIPVEGISPEQLTRSFEDRRSAVRTHEAIDILAPRNTPVKAVDDGTIARLFYSKAGGITVYQFDPSERFCYYYAHLERYADGLKEGDRVKKGQVIGYVGVSGNAPKTTPHLHFAVFRLTAAKRWWEGTPLDPYDILHVTPRDSSHSNLSGTPHRPRWCRKRLRPRARSESSSPQRGEWGWGPASQ